MGVTLLWTGSGGGLLTACLLAGGPALESAGRFFPVGPDSDGLSLAYTQNQNN